ncbi:hypothetical protein GPJ56_008661 [Histomonas meleagridis]|uniref:uncharacterized protein n=1 Tax=Histomonas meleagridis TaxID=135588 RepID=UPI00355A019E|nr:hypothetical protein GPJ56_008661 [Histomonas meleagridis]KAH0805762.1 hypothetical protein GO595_001401 [Histomonas meleagridis]
MIGQVVPVSNIRFKTGSDKRAILVDLVSKLCDLAITPKQTKEYMRLKEKYQNCKLEIKELQEKNQQISQEIDALPKENTNDPELERKVQKLSQLIKRQIHTQTKLIQNNEFEAKALKPIPTHSLSDDSGSSETFTKHKTKNHSIPKNKSMNHKLAKSNLSSDGSYFEGDFSESSMLSFHRKYEIDDSIAEKENTYGSIRKSYGNHVNQLINLTNKLQKDYNKLNIPKYSTSDLSIEELSRLNDSLLSSESKFGEYTE